MLRTSPPTFNESVKRHVDRLVKEDQQFTQNRRSSYRTPLVRPVSIWLPDQDEAIEGCTRNISPDGVGIMVGTPLEEGLTTKITIHALKGNDPAFFCELRWCVPFGKSWVLTGWRFINEARR